MPDYFSKVVFKARNRVTRNADRGTVPEAVVVAITGRRAFEVKDTGGMYAPVDVATPVVVGITPLPVQSWEMPGGKIEGVMPVNDGPKVFPTDLKSALCFYAVESITCLVGKGATR